MMGCEKPSEGGLTFGAWSVSFTERSDSSENVLSVGDSCLMEIELAATITQANVEWELTDPSGSVRWADSMGIGDTTIVFSVSDPSAGEWQFVLAKDNATGLVSTDTRIPQPSWSDCTGRANPRLQADRERQRSWLVPASAPS